MAGGRPAFKQGNVTFSVKFSRPCPRILGAFVLIFLALQPVGGTSSPQLLAYRLKDVKLETSNGVFVFSGGSITLLLFGEHFTNKTAVSFTEDQAGSCDPSTVNLIAGGTVSLEPTNTSDFSDGPQIATLMVEISSSLSKTFYFCVRGESDQDYVHQGTETWLQLKISPPLLPIWAEVIFICILLVLSGLFSGLNLGLMSLDPTTLKIVMESGSPRHKIYAKLIYKVRKHGNYLLCTLLLGNVLVNSALAILLDSVLGSGAYAIVASTVAIVIFGEIIPQAICSRYGLVVGAWTIPLTFVFMVLTFPISLPLSLLLNLVLGKEIGSVYDREQLLKLLDVTQEHHDLEKDEVNIISGALAFKKKIAEDVMTKIDNVYCLSNNRVLDFKTIKEIYESGFSRIPIYEEGDRNDIVGILYVRDLAFLDPDDQTPIQAHLEFYNYEVLKFWTDSTLGELLLRFTEGKSHLGIIQRVNNETEMDPFYEVVGIVTLEDIVEEILQREIVDETDRYMDNRTWKPHAKRKHFNVGEFMEPSQTLMLSSQQRLAVYQFLTGIEPFSKQHMSPSVLKRLLDQDIVRHLSVDDFKSDDHTLYSAGSPASFFTLIVEGCVQVNIGSDGMEFQSRSFSYFGTQALLNTLEDSQADYIPDYTVRPTMDCLVVIITQRQYIAARNATLFGKERRSIGDGGDSDEGEKGGGGGGGEGDSPRKTFDLDSQVKSDVFTKEWEMAETHDLENSLVSKSGLTPIARLFKKRPHSKQNVKSDRRGLLTLSSTESEAGSSDSSGASGAGKGDQLHIQISIDEERELTLDASDGVPLVDIDKGAAGGGPGEFRTTPGGGPPIESYSSSPRFYHTTQV